MAVTSALERCGSQTFGARPSPSPSPSTDAALLARRVPQVPIQVPLWMAVALAKSAKCVIQPPQWMEPLALADVLQKEREGNWEESSFQARTLHTRLSLRLPYQPWCRAAAPCVLQRRAGGCAAERASVER